MSSENTTAASAQQHASSTIRIGTRRSKLALLQTDIVLASLKQLFPTNVYEVNAMSTAGDKNQSVALYAIGSKNLWTEELEAHLLSGELDLIVHSLKDMPTRLPTDCTLGAILPRADARDALVYPSYAPEPTPLSALPAGSIVGTSSVRRSAQLARYYPHLRVKDVRGNVGTRLAKLDDPDQQYACLVLAVAGLERLGLESRIGAKLSWDGPTLPRDPSSNKLQTGWLHAVGQGALGIEIRTGDTRISELVGALQDTDTALACAAERAVMRQLEGGCSVPVGVETSWVDVADDDSNWERCLKLRASVVSLDGREAIDIDLAKHLKSWDEAEAFGTAVADQLIQRGAGAILQQIVEARRSKE